MCPPCKRHSFLHRREVPAVQLQYSFASDKYVHWFSLWMILNSVGMIQISIHFINWDFLQISVFMGYCMVLIRHSNEVQVTRWILFKVWLQYSSVVELSFQQNNQPVMLPVTLSAWTTGAYVGWMGRLAHLIPRNDEAAVWGPINTTYITAVGTEKFVWSVMWRVLRYDLDKKWTFLVFFWLSRSPGEDGWVGFSLSIPALNSPSNLRKNFKLLSKNIPTY